MTSFLQISPLTLCRSSFVYFALLLAGLTTQAQTTTWTGSLGTDWDTPGNWSPALVPTTVTDVVIPNVTNDPILSTTATANSVEVQSGASLSISSGGSLTINGSKTISGNTIALFNKGTVTTSGQVAIGNITTANVGKYGIRNEGTFTNNAGGSIQIDRSTDTGLYNEAGSFNNSATVTIGASTTIGKDGLFNNAAFTNNGAGFLQIDRSTSTGIANLGGSFTNTATITIGAGETVGNYGILNQATFANGTGGTVQIDRSTLGGVFNNGSSFTNSASLVIGKLATPGGFGINNKGTFSNSGGGSIQIDRSTNQGVFNEAGNFVNSATLSIGSSFSIGGEGLVNRGSFTNTTGASIQIDRTGRDGLLNSNSSSSFINSSSITIGSLASIGIDGIVNQGSFTNTTGASIQIDRTGRDGLSIINSSSSFVNAGVIDIGQSTSLGRHGILNRGVFTNTAISRIRIDRIPTISAISAVVNQTAATFTNAGTITVGASASAGQDGILNLSIFINQASGRIYVDRTWGNGIWNTSAAQLFQNAGVIVLGANAPTGISGLLNVQAFTNLAGGDIQIDQPSGNGLANVGASGNFTNNGRIRIGLIASPGAHGIANFTSASFVNGTGGEIIISPLSSSAASAIDNAGTYENRACANLTIADDLFNNSVFTNAGLFTVNTTQVHSNTALTNNGTISYLQNSFIPNVTNNALILQSFTVCSSFSPAIQASVSNSLTVGTTWYKDAGLTTAAGTYDQATNTFTVTNLAAPNSYTLYMAVTDAANACSYTAAIPVTTKAVPVVTLTPSPSSTLSCAQPLITLTASTGASSYSFSPGTTSTGSASVVSVSLAGVYSVTVTNSVGCAAIASTTITGSSTPVSASLIPSSSGLCSNGSVVLTASGGINYAFSGPGVSQNGTSPTAVATQSGTYSVLVTGANGCTASASTSLTITVAPSAGLFTSAGTGGFVAQATGGVAYERTIVIDRINGYEIRQTEQNATGYFIIDRAGPFSITVIGANGCRGVVNGVAP